MEIVMKHFKVTTNLKVYYRFKRHSKHAVMCGFQSTMQMPGDCHFSKEV